MNTLDNAHALIIGIAAYQHVRPLPPVRDATALRDLLIDPALGGYAPASVTLLNDDQATQTAILAALHALVERADADSTVLIYVSGHGGRITQGPNAGEYLLPVDADGSSDEALARSSISGADLTAALREIPARRLLAIFDCCHAAGVAQPRDIGGAPALAQPGLSDATYDAVSAGRGRVVLASSRADEFSYVLNNAEYGLFTEHLLGGLRGGVASDDGIVRVFDLFEYLQPRVTAQQPQQHPIFKGELENNFAVARSSRGPTTPIARDDQGFRYDAYISYVDRGADADWVWSTLVPRLEAAGLRLAVGGDSIDPGVARVVGIERGIEQARRTIVVLSEAYLADHSADFENVLAQTIGIQQGSYRLLPIKAAPLDDRLLPARLSMLQSLDLSQPRRADREWERLIRALQGPLPRR